MAEKQQDKTITSSDDIIIDTKHGLTTLPSPPQSMTLLKSVQLPSPPLSVCQYKGSTYVALYNSSVTRIDNNYQLHNSFISTSGPIESISAYKEKFYTLSVGNPHVVNVHDMSGKHITSWNHPYHMHYSDTLTAVADQVVIAEPKNQRITVYSLTGESLRHIPCPLITNTNTALRAVDNTSVVVSNCGTCQVFKMNITTGEVKWSLSDVMSPQGLACDENYILLGARNDNTVYVIDTSTGSLVSELTDHDISGALVFGLGVSGTTLIVPKWNSNQVLFYQLNMK